MRANRITRLSATSGRAALQLTLLLVMAMVIAACSTDGSETSDEPTGEEATPEEMAEDDDDEMMADDDDMMADDDDEMMANDEDDMMADDEDEMMMADDMSSGMEVLAEHLVDDVPDDPLVWVAHEVAVEPDEPLTVEPDAFGFVYAATGSHTVSLNGEETMLAMGESVFSDAGQAYTVEGDGTIWDIRLAEPDAELSGGLEDADVVFTSEELEGFPEPAQVRFIRVDLAPGGRTEIHTHPGPEFIYVTEGEIVYENEMIGTDDMQSGDSHGMSPDTAVQKRNESDDMAVFLSWFVVDPDEPFSPHSDFD